jgi:hypothetical protein
MIGSTANYHRPARFRQLMDPHHARLVEHGVIEDVEYLRGGTFVYHLRNYLRVQLRRVLCELGVFPKTAAALVAGFDETDIMAQCDCLRHGVRGRAEKPGGYVTEAIRNGWELHYGADEPEQFGAMWGLFSSPERAAYHRAGLHLCGGGSLFDEGDDPSLWSQRLRAVARFMMVHNLDPDEIVRGEGMPLTAAA